MQVGINTLSDHNNTISNRTYIRMDKRRQDHRRHPCDLHQAAHSDNILHIVHDNGPVTGFVSRSCEATLIFAEHSLVVAPAAKAVNEAGLPAVAARAT